MSAFEQEDYKYPGASVGFAIELGFGQMSERVIRFSPLNEFEFGLGVLGE